MSSSLALPILRGPLSFLSCPPGLEQEGRGQLGATERRLPYQCVVTVMLRPEHGLSFTGHAAGLLRPPGGIRRYSSVAWRCPHVCLPMTASPQYAPVYLQPLFLRANSARELWPLSMGLIAPRVLGPSMAAQHAATAAFSPYLLSGGSTLCLGSLESRGSPVHFLPAPGVGRWRQASIYTTEKSANSTNEPPPHSTLDFREAPLLLQWGRVGPS